MSSWGAKEIIVGGVFTLVVFGGVGGFVAWQVLGSGGSGNASASGSATTGAVPLPPAPPPGNYLVLPPLPAPEAFPWVGEEGTDPYGYPLRRVDPIGLQTLLRLRRFEDLERYCGEIATAYDADFRKERWRADALSAFDSSDPRLTAPLDAWVAAYPRSSTALLARGTHRRAVAWRHRGGGYINTVSEAQQRGFASLMAEARRDVEAGAALDAHNVQAWVLLSTVAREQGDGGVAASALARARLECPQCLAPYEVQMRFLAPRWGGSHAAMDALAQEARAQLGANPALASLAGFRHEDRCQTTMQSGDFAGALDACNEAVAAGTHSTFLARRAEVYVALERYADALTDADAALRLKPRSEMGLDQRYTALMAQDDFEQAADAVELYVYLDPASAGAFALATHAAQGLNIGAHGLYASDRARALRLVDRALVLDPSNENASQLQQWVLQWLVNPDNPEHLTTEQVAERAAAAPDSYEAQRDYDTVLYMARRTPEIIALWDAYIARHPDDGRAYRERSGANHNSGRMAEYRADALRACELGDPPACHHTRGWTSAGAP